MRILNILPVGILDLQYYFNRLSLCGQFGNASEFESAFSVVMQCRQLLSEHDQKLHIDGQVLNAMVTPNDDLRSALNALDFDRDKRRLVLRWLDTEGPFWDSEPLHSADDYLTCEIAGEEEVVTETVVAEVAHLNFAGISSGLFSIAPSMWCVNPLSVSLVKGSDEALRSIDIVNLWDTESVRQRLPDRNEEPTNWPEVTALTNSRYSHLRFSENWLDAASRHPYDGALVTSLLRLLEILDKLRFEIDQHGRSSSQVHDYYNRHFASGNLFSDSSASEKQRYSSRLKFSNPDSPGKYLSCTWHGKIRRLAWRLHFSAPLSVDSPLYIVYFGPKLTQQ